MNTVETQSTRKPYTTKPCRYEDEDDKGSVQDCFSCGLAYFSRWEPHKAFSVRKLTPDPEDLVCPRCVSQRIFERNIKALKKQRH
jgi:hypothetical protein